MSTDLLLLIADRFGVFVFAISGGIVAVRKDMDIVGVIVLAFLPAIGGGTLRDVLLDQPVFWLNDAGTIYFSILGGLTAFVMHRWISKFKPLRWADAFGMALFAATGAAKAHLLGYDGFVVIMMGTITASFGGLLRDVVANEDPLLLKEEVYASAAIAAAAAYFIAASSGVGALIAFLIAAAIGVVIRGLAIIFNWSLPKSPF